MTTILIARIALGSLPVLLLLSALVYLDSYKLLSLRRVLALVGAGGLVALAGYAVNHALVSALSLDPTSYSRYAAPIVEESAKGLIVAWMIRTHRLGFLVDTAVCGFALGTGFAVVENLYYMTVMPEAGLVVWLVRGCGTALMHGGATAIFGMVAKSLSERHGSFRLAAWMPGLAVAAALHSAFNHFFLSPVASTAGILVVLPPLLYVVFEQSERSLERWLHAGFDADVELLQLIDSGDVSNSHVGAYLRSLREKFHGPVVADMVCLLRIDAELSIRAKGLLMLRQAGLPASLDEETRAKLAELDYLEGSVGLTGRLALAPFLRAGARDLWQLRMLGR